MNVDISQLKAFRDKLQKLDSQKMNKFSESAVKELAARLLRKVKSITPTKTGELKRNWQVGEVNKNGDIYEIEVFNQTEYAEYVEYGHRQTPGRYVPAIGKRLKNNWVKGKFMLTISTKELEADAPKIIEKKLQQFLAEALND
jgi:HK97 gp10 family phage protein